MLPLEPLAPPNFAFDYGPIVVDSSDDEDEESDHPSQPSDDSIPKPIRIIQI